MASDRDIALADERDSGGLALDDDLAEKIPLVGFDDDTGFGDVEFVGFDEVPASADHVGRGRQSLAERSRRAALAAWSAALALFRQLRFRLTGTHLSMRRLQNAAVVAVAVLIALGIGLAVRSWLPARQPVRVVAAPVAPPPVKAVLVASEPIGRGRVLQPTDVRWQPWPPADIKQSYFLQGTRSAGEFDGYVARVPIAAGQPLTADNIAAPAGHGFMAAMLQPGMRAISVAIGAETAASGLIVPGDDVDIMLSMPVPAFDANGAPADRERASVETLLRSVRVLAIDQETDGKAGHAIVGQAATLEVTPKEAEVITLANELAARGGMLVLALRSLRGETADGHRAIAPSHLLDTDVSKLMTDRPVTPPQSRPLTIVRRDTLSQP